MVQDKAILTMADQYKVVYYISIDVIFSDLERPLNAPSVPPAQMPPPVTCPPVKRPRGHLPLLGQWPPVSRPPSLTWVG